MRTGPVLKSPVKQQLHNHLSLRNYTLSFNLWNWELQLRQRVSHLTDLAVVLVWGQWLLQGWIGGKAADTWRQRLTRMKCLLDSHLGTCQPKQCEALWTPVGFRLLHLSSLSSFNPPLSLCWADKKLQRWICACFSALALPPVSLSDHLEHSRAVSAVYLP